MVVKETSSSAVDSIVTFINFYSLADFWITVIPVVCNVSERARNFHSRKQLNQPPLNLGN